MVLCGKNVRHASTPDCCCGQECLRDKQSLLTWFAVMQVVAWYDNEWGYSQRVLDLAEITAKNWEE